MFVHKFTSYKPIYVEKNDDFSTLLAYQAPKTYVNLVLFVQEWIVSPLWTLAKYFWSFVNNFEKLYFWVQIKDLKSRC